MNGLVTELSTARENVINTVNKIDPKKADEVILGTWNLKDIIAHLSGWANHQIAVLRAIKSNKTPSDYGNVDEYNCQSTESRKNKSWEEIYKEFKEKSGQLVKEYESLTDINWKQLIWPNRKTTPEKFVKIEIKHYQETHLPQIKKLLEV